MNYRDALRILGVKPSMTLDNITKAYKALVIKAHPDHGGNLQWFQDVREAYKIVLKFYQYEKETVDKTTGERKTERVNLTKELQEKIIEIFSTINTEMIDIEITGTWVWLFGNTYEQKDDIKKLGFKFSRNKIRWYWHNGDTSRSYRGKTDMNEIRSKYGSMNVESNRPKLLKAGK